MGEAEEVTDLMNGRRLEIVALPARQENLLVEEEGRDEQDAAKRDSASGAAASQLAHRVGVQRRSLVGQLRRLRGALEPQRAHVAPVETVERE